MVTNLKPDEIYRFIISDFEGAWDSLASNPKQNVGRGNFMFARQAMSLLEFAARLYGNNTNIHSKFSNDLENIDQKYFMSLPSPCVLNTDFVLPHTGDSSGRILLWALFDLIRHGLAHQYQQIVVALNDLKIFYVSFPIGAEYNKHLSVSKCSRLSNHLALSIDNDGDLKVSVYPDTLYLDIKYAIESSGLLKQGLSFPYLSRPIVRRLSLPRSNGIKFYDFDLKSLEKCLVAGNHMKL
jgi:hypothetical protein